MTWRFTGKNKHGDAVEPIPGLPLEASDADFAAAVKAMGLDIGTVKASALYAQTKDKADTEGTG